MAKQQRVRRLNLACDVARRDLYSFISAAALPPSDRAFELIRDAQFRNAFCGAVNLMRVSPSFHPPSLGPVEIHPSEFSPEDLARSADDSIGQTYEVLFGIGISKDYPPYEVEYCSNPDTTYRSQQLADVAGFYRAFGLDRAEDAHDRADHLASEAEFMAILITRTIYARTQGLDSGHIEVCLDAQRQFFKDHLGWWLAPFGIALEKRAGRGFYAEFANLLRAFVAAERAVFGLPPFPEITRTARDLPVLVGNDACVKCISEPGLGMDGVSL